MTDREIIDAIRKDPVVGRGTCSIWDECYADEELVAHMRDYENSVTSFEVTIEEMVKLAHKTQDAFQESTHTW